ncbi:alcohol dehydrogenase catalytic domain-containing protein [Paraburkholderia sp. 32]|uniref:alcohol dehydrogenase catalytic domain-containing protein n=1 Tax=Paraburkholderia sp. 32 TaxID=2991057 RepID=UPI003D20158B
MLQIIVRDFASPALLKNEDVAVPTITNDDVLLKVEATALGFVDGLMLQGRYQIKPPLPYVPGGEICGVVEEVGSNVTGVVPGDRVVTWQLGGGLAEYVRVPFREVQVVASSLDPVSAAAMLVDYQTAHYALVRRGSFVAGETVLVLGAAGGVGSAAVQIAARLGGKVIAAVSTAEKAERVRGLGAIEVINSGTSGMSIRDQLKNRGLDGY